MPVQLKICNMDKQVVLQSALLEEKVETLVGNPQTPVMI